MAMSKGRVIAELNRLYRLCRNSERGFNVAAENVDNRGLKTLLKTYAQQRARFADELRALVIRLDGKPSERTSLPGAIHRGWIDIRNAMTIGQENTENGVLIEARRGERVAVRRYERALQKEWPPEIHEVIERQFENIRQVRERIRLLHGADGDRMVVRLFDRNELVEQAKQALESAGFGVDTLESVELNEVAREYQEDGDRRVLFETVLAAALLGVVVGGAIGLVGALAALVVGALDTSESANVLGTIVTTTIYGSLIGACFIGLIGVLIGIGVTEEDDYLYADSIQHGHTLLMVHAPNHARASEASSIMYRINVASRAAPQAA